MAQPDMEQVYREHSRLVYRYLLSRTGDADAAEELTQETFYRAVKGSERFDGSCRVSTWLVGIAKNLLRERLRKQPESELTEAAIANAAAETAAAESEALSSLSRLELLQRLHALAEPAREVVYLRSFGGFSFKEIGEATGNSENWARVTFYRAKERLKKEMENDEK